MSGTPKYKIFDAGGCYQAACKEIEAAASLMSFYGIGSTIRLGHSTSDIVWTEGRDEWSASESYDAVARVVLSKKRERNIKGLMRNLGLTREQAVAEVLKAEAA